MAHDLPGVRAYRQGVLTLIVASQLVLLNNDFLQHCREKAQRKHGTHSGLLITSVNRQEFLPIASVSSSIFKMESNATCEMKSLRGRYHLIKALFQTVCSGLEGIA